MKRGHPPYELTPLKVKICGLTRVEDVRWAVECGADFLGIVLCESPRRVRGHDIAELIWTAKEAESPPPVVAVVRDPTDREITRLPGLGFDGIQLHGAETPERVREIATLGPGLFLWKALGVHGEGDLTALRSFECDAVLLDSLVEGKSGGSGRRIEMAAEPIRAAGRDTRIIVAGGLDPETVIDAVVDFEPFGVDVSSGVESSPGVKDPEKVRSFIDNARKAAELRALDPRRHHGAQEKSE